MPQTPRVCQVVSTTRMHLQSSEAPCKWTHLRGPDSGTLCGSPSSTAPVESLSGCPRTTKDGLWQVQPLDKCERRSVLPRPNSTHRLRPGRRGAGASPAFLRRSRPLERLPQEQGLQQAPWPGHESQKAWFQLVAPDLLLPLTESELAQTPSCTPFTAASIRILQR